MTPLSANGNIRLPGNGWRNRIGEEGVEWMLTQTIEAGRKSGAIDDASLKRVAVDIEDDQKMRVGPHFPAEA